MNQVIDHQAPTERTTRPASSPLTNTALDTSTEPVPAAGLDNTGFNPAPWQTLLTVIRDTFPARFDTPNPSLALVRVLTETCARLHIPATPAPVFLDITRGPAHTGHREGGIDERALLATPTGWTGHLVAIADLGAGRTILLDPSADRFDRPIRNLILGGPLTAPIAPHRPVTTTTATSTAASSTPLAVLHPRHGDDTTLTYRTIPTHHPHRDDWQRTDWWQPDTDAAHTAIRAATTATHLYDPAHLIGPRSA